jgi:hypothetical protein
MVTRLDVGYTLSNGLNDTGTLMTENNRESTLGVFSGECVGICSIFQQPALSPQRSTARIPVWQTPVEII